MGTVFKAEDTRLGRFVALKFLAAESAQDADAVSRFRSEAKAASALNHPNICTIYDIGECEAGTFIAMEWLEGESLRDLLRRKALTPERLLKLASQIADGLAAAHAQKIVHRDIKPENLFVLHDDRIKILDFGIAKLHKPALRPDDTTQSSSSVSRQGLVIGTLHYMSPEQARAEDVDWRTDLFSLAAVIFEMAARRRAFPGATAADVFATMLRVAPVLPRNLDPRFRTALQVIIDKGLEKNRDFRYQDAADLSTDLRRVQRDMADGRLPSPVPPRIAAPRPIQTRILGDIGRAIAVAVIALLTHGSLSRSAAGRYLEQFELAYLQSGAYDESDFAAGGRHLPLVVDLSAVHPDKRQPTDRRLLDVLIAELRRNGAAAVGVDLSFDDVQPTDFQYFARWLSYRNVRIGIYRRATEKREAWLGRPEFSALAAGIAMPADNPQYAFAFSRRWSARTEIADGEHYAPQDCNATEQAANCKDDLYQLPVALWLIAATQASGEEKLYKTETPESRLIRAVGPLESQFLEGQANASLELARYQIDYSYLKELRRDTLSLEASGTDVVAELATQLRAHRARIADRVVLIGDLEDTSDHLCYTSNTNPLAGALVHACALATLNRGMLSNSQTTISTSLWTAFVLLVLSVIVVLRLAHAKSPSLRQVPHQHLEMFVFGVLSVVVVVTARSLASRRGMVWPDVFWVAGALAIYSMSKPFYRAVSAVPRVVHFAFTRPDRIARGV